MVWDVLLYVFVDRLSPSRRYVRYGRGAMAAFRRGFDEVVR